jgi:predicted dehydrogenase
MIRFGIVGTGWRTRFFLRVAHALSDRFEVVADVTQTVEQAVAHEGHQKQFVMPASTISIW